MMPDLHTHPAVVHLLASEFCPRAVYTKAKATLVYRDDVYPPYWAWKYELEGETQPEYPFAYDYKSSLTLAAVRAIMAWRGYVDDEWCQQADVWFGPDNISPTDFACQVTWDNDYDIKKVHRGPTELEAVLEAYKATVMEEPRRA